MTDGGPGAIGARIREWREGRGLTKVALAHGLHIHGKSCGTLVAEWESGSAFPSYWNLLELAKFFHVTLEELTDFNPKE